MRQALGTEVEHGAIITDITPDGAAEKAGLKVQDIIIEVNNKKIENNRELINAIGLMSPGDEVDIRLRP